MINTIFFSNLDMSITENFHCTYRKMKSCKNILLSYLPTITLFIFWDLFAEQLPPNVTASEVRDRKPTLKVDCKEINGLAFLPGGHVITCGQSGLTVYNQYEGEVKHSLSSELCGRKLWDVAVDNARSKVAVVEGRLLILSGRLHIYAHHSGAWERTEHDICQSPRSLACTADGDFIIGDNSKYIYKYSSNGKKIWWTKLPSCPRYISVDSLNRILVNHGGKVSIYDITQGSELSTFITWTGPLTKWSGRGMCVDTRDNILIVFPSGEESAKSTVKQYSNSGECIKKILAIDEKTELVASYMDKYLAVLVSQEKNQQLHLYKLKRGNANGIEI